MTKKLLIVCAAIFLIGALMTVGGYAAGGRNGFRKTEDGYKWVGSNNPHRVINSKDFVFDSIEVKGFTDVELVSGKYYEETLRDQKAASIEAKAGKVITISEEGGDVPSVKVEGKTLIIESVESDSFSLSSITANMFVPKVIVLCDDQVLTSVKADCSASDVTLLGIAFDQADIDIKAGDLEVADITSNGLKVHLAAGDAEVSGVLKGLTDIKAQAGDIEVDTFAGLKSYTIDLSCSAGDIRVGKTEIGKRTYTQEGGADTLKLDTSAGDIALGEL